MKHVSIAAALVILCSIIYWFWHGHPDAFQGTVPQSQETKQAPSADSSLELPSPYTPFRRAAQQPERKVLNHERERLTRLQTAYVRMAAGLEPELSRAISNVVLGAAHEHWEKLRQYTDAEILQAERQDISAAQAFQSPEGQAFRELLVELGLTGPRMDYYHRRLVEIAHNWQSMQALPDASEFPDAPADFVNRIRSHREVWRMATLAFAHAEFAGMNVDVDLLLDRALKLPVPNDIPELLWPPDPGRNKQEARFGEP